MFFYSQRFREEHLHFFTFPFRFYFIFSVSLVKRNGEFIRIRYGFVTYGLGNEGNERLRKGKGKKKKFAV